MQIGMVRSGSNLQSVSCSIYLVKYYLYVFYSHWLPTLVALLGKQKFVDADI